MPTKNTARPVHVSLLTLALPAYGQTAPATSSAVAIAPANQALPKQFGLIDHLTELKSHRIAEAYPGKRQNGFTPSIVPRERHA